MDKNIMYGGLGILVLLVVGWYLFSGTQGVATDSTQNGQATTTDATASSTVDSTATSSGNVDTTLQGKVKVILGYPISWPADVPRYPVPAVKYNGGNNPQSGPVEATVIFTTKDSVKSVVSFYLAGLRANGWKITEDGAGTGNMTTFRATKGTRSVGGYAVRETNGTTNVTIGVNIGL